MLELNLKLRRNNKTLSDFNATQYVISMRLGLTQATTYRVFSKADAELMVKELVKYHFSGTPEIRICEDKGYSFIYINNSQDCSGPESKYRVIPASA